MTARFLAVAGLVIAAAGAHAQAPSEDWRTIETEHYRVHFPKDYEVWARHAAGKLEEIRTMVTPVIGYEPSEITDVVVADPLAMPNGSAWPFIGSPRMVLWASPPGPGSILAHQTDWAEIVAIHEDAHLVHLLRPTRDPLRALGWYLLPIRIGPVTGAPRWAIEGYATVIEGQLTGMGRPHGDMRAAILRRWAQEGRLPSYERLASDSSAWLGQSMAYLVGSAYLEWLLEREGEESLKAVWARLTARQSRTFDEAFEGVYGDSPKRLYQRFTAELTKRALLVEDTVRDTAREGALWQDFSWFTELPDLSPDGAELVTVRRPREGPATLVVLSTKPDEEAESKRLKRLDEMLARDPEDVAPVDRRPRPLKPKYRLSRKSGAVPQTPRWIGETGHILFVEFVPDRNGVMHPDVFRWNPKTDAVWRLTVEADLRDAEPIDEGAGAIAVRNRFGASQLVRVDFASGEVEPITEASILRVCGNPRVSPDERRLAYVVQQEGRWNLVIRDLSSGAEESLPFDGTVAHPEWSPDGTRIYASVGSNGFVEIHEFTVEGLETGRGRPITRSSSALFGPASGTEDLYFLSMDVDGIDVRKLSLASARDDLPALDVPSSLAPAVRVPSREVRKPLDPQPLGDDRPYGIGNLEVSPLMSGSWAPSGGTFELGARVGDLVGRTEMLALGSFSTDGGAQGGTLSGLTRRWPVVIVSRLSSVEERPSDQSFDEPFGPAVADRERTGVELEAFRVLRWRASSLTLGGGAWWSEIDATSNPSVDQWGTFGRISYEGRPTSGTWSYPQSASLDIASGSTDETSFTRVAGRFSFGVLRKGTGVVVDVARGDVDDDAHALDQFEVGGLRTSLHAGSAMFGNRVWAAGLPYGTLAGSSFTRLCGSLQLSGLPASLFYERIETSTEDRDDAIGYAGIELEWNLEPMPLVRIPAATITLGVSMAFDEPLEDDVRGWIGLRWSH